MLELKNRRIEVKVGRTINLGNYGFKKIDIGVSGDIKDDDFVLTEINELYKMLEDEINKQIKDA
jgi:hypothetical protein